MTTTAFSLRAPNNAGVAPLHNEETPSFIVVALKHCIGPENSPGTHCIRTMNMIVRCWNEFLRVYFIIT